MNERHLELTSAFLDGEVADDDPHKAVSAILGAGGEALDCFGRYRLIGDVMRGESAGQAHSVAARVHEALRDEPVVLAPPRRVAPRWTRPAAGLAIAASVAAAAIVVAPRLMPQSDPGLGSQQTVMQAPLATPAPMLVASGPGVSSITDRNGLAAQGHWQTLDKELEDRLNRLVIEHNEFGGRTGINGPVPHIGFVGYDAR